ncbi:MAG: cytochrome C552, partial [Gammaproteobacteria bacterium]|nr:cytochrome C552 [Gammaproteobacteria bacterium]
MGTTLGVALFFMLLGVIFWGGFNTAMEATNTMEFCISCHEMEENVYQEYRETIHYSNRSGVRASCSDCHVPDPWVHKFIRKIKASQELLHKALGTIDTPEKFDKKRLTLAKNVWRTMKQTDSRECRNCHDFDSMNPEDQKKRSRKQHISGMQAGNTCIDCHKGIAHKKVHDQLSDDELTALGMPNERNKRPIPPQWQALIDGETQAEPVEVEEQSTPKKEAVDTPVTAQTAKVTKSESGIDWAAIEAHEVTLFYPGQASMEWVMKGSDHGGKRAVATGDRCFDCHEDEEVDIGDIVV